MQLSFRIVSSNDSLYKKDLQELYDIKKAEHRTPGRQMAHVAHNFHFIIAYADGKPVGYLEYSTMSRTRDRKSFFTWETYVPIPFRRQKIATQMTQRLIVHARKKGITLIRRLNQSPSMVKVSHDMKAKPRTAPSGVKPELFRLVNSVAGRDSSIDTFIHVRPRKLLRKH